LRAVQVPASPGSTPARITRCCKPLGAIGDGGMAVTFDAALVDRLRRLRQYGWDEERVTHETGWRKWRPCSLPACRDARSTMDERDSVIHHKTGDVSDKNSCENSGAPFWKRAKSPNSIRFLCTLQCEAAAPIFSI
jgi:hypothetical protein